MHTINALLLVCLASCLALHAAAANQQKPARVAKQDDDDSADPTARPFRQTCGNKTEVAARSARCMEPIFELVEGRNFSEAKSDADIVPHCERFASVEKCIRQTARDCLDGVHKAAASAMAASSRRFRVKECKNAETRAKYGPPVKCVLQRSEDTRKLYKNLTEIAFRIHELPIPSEARFVKVCCLILALENESTKLFTATCPESLETILNLQRAITEDARNTLCRNPNCKGVLEKLPARKSSKVGLNLIEPLLLTMFDL